MSDPIRSGMWHRFWSIAVAAVTLVPPLHGQTSGAVEAGSGALSVGAQGMSGIMLVAPSVRLQSSIFHFQANGQYAGLSEGGWQTLGQLNTGARQKWGPFVGELGATAGWSRVAWGRAAGGWLGAGRLSWGDFRGGLSLSVGAGHTFTTEGAQPLSMVEAGSWGRIAGLDLGLKLRRTGLTVAGSQEDRSGSPPLQDSLPTPVSTGRRLLQDHYTDTDATVGWHGGALELEGGVGRRFGKPAARYTSWHLRGLYWIAPRLGLVVSMGRFPTDVVSGMPSGSFATLSMRINLRGGPQPLSPAPLAVGRWGATGFAATPAGGGTLSVEHPRSRGTNGGNHGQFQPVAAPDARDAGEGMVGDSGPAGDGHPRNQRAG